MTVLTIHKNHKNPLDEGAHLLMIKMEIFTKRVMCLVETFYKRILFSSLCATPSFCVSLQSDCENNV